MFLNSFSVTIFTPRFSPFFISVAIKVRIGAEIGTLNYKAWSHMVLHLPHAEGGFGVTCNDVTKDVVFYTTTLRFVSWSTPSFFPTIGA